MATANTTINNYGSIISAHRGINGSAQAWAIGVGSLYHGTNAGSVGGYGLGGHAEAGVTITNAGTINAIEGHGIVGDSLAVAGAIGFFAQGGTSTAIANTTINNLLGGNITSSNTAIEGHSTALADGFGSFNSFLIPAPPGPAIDPHGTGAGGIASATTVITNAAILTSFDARGIDGGSFASASGFGYFGSGGTATAYTSISNGGSIYSEHRGINGGAAALAIGFGSAYNTYGIGGFASGGTASAGVIITNTGKIVAFDGHGIVGSSFANADALGFIPPTENNPGALPHFATPSGPFTNAWYAQAGTATATTQIVNYSGSKIKSGSTAIEGDATAFADAFGSFSSYYIAKTSTLYHGTGVGGTATATTSISNGGTLISYGGRGIDGNSFASASGFGYFGTGGSATATTSINNYGPITSQYRGINGSATAFAIGVGSLSNKYGVGGSGLGGHASAGVLITNSAAITAADGHGIVGDSLAVAGAIGFYAQGGTSTAIATTTINNLSGGNITSSNTGIEGNSVALADAFGSFESFAHPTDPHGTGVGGIATATTFITNAATINSSHGRGIDGNSVASASGFGYFGTGGTANAFTSISNTGAVSSQYRGINGSASAFAIGFGSTFNSLGVGGYALGGTASAGAVVNNSSTITTKVGQGMVGGSLAVADAVGYIPSNHGGNAPAFSPTFSTPPAWKAQAGHATATTTMSNGGTITSADNGMSGWAGAYADAWGHTAYGNYASANVQMVNTGKITSSGGDGIDGKSVAKANAYGVTKANGGKDPAIAITTITNSGPIVAAINGIYGGAAAYANGSASSGNGTGGDATAHTTITNSGSVIAGILNGGNGIAIYGNTLAEAKGTSHGSGTGAGGTATATTTITNAVDSTVISLYGKGIVANTTADTTGYSKSGLGTGGVASASTKFTNTITVLSYSTGIGIYDTARANGTGGKIGHGGTANAYTYISNSGNVISRDGNGIYGKSYAVAGGYSTNTAIGGQATATTIVTNSGKVFANTNDRRRH